MLLKKEIEKLLTETYGIAFDIVEAYEHQIPHVIITPSNAEEQLFSLSISFQSAIRMNVAFEPQKYAIQMVREMGNAAKNKKILFCEYANRLSEEGAKLFFRVNDTPIDASNCEYWPASWSKVSLGISVIPIIFDEKDHPNYLATISKWLPLMMGLSLSLLHVEKLDTTSSQVEGEEEGRRFEVTTTRYERSPINRTLCLATHGYSCKVCGFNFEARYGEIGHEYIQVHHLTPVSLMGDGFIVNPATDLAPVCPNCHAMLHKKNPPYTIEELKNKLK